MVTGHRGGEVAAAAEALGARSVANPRFDDGMYTSVQAGAAAIPEGRRFFLLPVDCPLVRPETAGRLARAGAAAGAEVVLPEFEGAAGHPPLLAPALREAILTAEPAGGLRELLAGRPEPALRVAVDDPGVASRRRRARRSRAAPCTRGGRATARRSATATQVLLDNGVTPQRLAHSRAVAAVATALTAALNERCRCLCVPLVVAARPAPRRRPRRAAARRRGGRAAPASRLPARRAAGAPAHASG